MPITRRTLSGLLTFLTMGGSAFLVVDAARAGLRFDGRLQRALSDWTARHAPDSVATVVNPVALDLPGGRVRVSLAVHLDWPPGMRQTAYAAEAATVDDASRDLEAWILADLAAAHGVSPT